MRQNQDLHVLDVREKEEFDDANIGATLLPLSQLRNMEIDAIEDWDEADEIVLFKQGRIEILGNPQDVYKHLTINS